MRTVKAIYSEVQVMVAGSGNNNVYVGADDLVPIFLYVLCQSHPSLAHPLLNTQLLWSLAHPDQLQGEGGYVLTVYESALDFVLKEREDGGEEDEDEEDEEGGQGDGGLVRMQVMRHKRNAGAGGGQGALTPPPSLSPPPSRLSNMMQRLVRLSSFSAQRNNQGNDGVEGGEAERGMSMSFS